MYEFLPPLGFLYFCVPIHNSLDHVGIYKNDIFYNKKYHRQWNYLKIGGYLFLTIVIPMVKESAEGRVPKLKSMVFDHTLPPPTPSNFLQVLTLSMLVFTARQIHHSSPGLTLAERVFNQLLRNLDRMTICGKA